MTRAIRKHLRDFLALTLMALVAIGVAGYILSNQRLYLPAWVPGIGTDFYVVEAEFTTAQAVVPGQGQTVDIAGVPVGDLGRVRLEDGVAIVEMKIRRKYAPIYRDASLLLRPKTGLKDMIVEMDPGTPAAGEVPEGGLISVANTLPDVNPDEILAELDTDTRSYLQVLINAGGDAFSDEDASADARETFKRFEPTNRDLAAITRELEGRRRNLARVIHNFGRLTEAVGERDDDVRSLVSSANANFRALAEQDTNIREVLRLLPGTLETAETTLLRADTLANELGPTMQSLRPAARALGPALRETRPFLRTTTPIILDQLRPFARATRPTVRDLRRAAEDLAPLTPRLTRSVRVVNSLLNTLAYNPPGPEEEGFLFWASWAGHAGNSIFGTQDAHGAIRRGIVIASCDTLALVERVADTQPQLRVLTELLNAPESQQVCPGAGQGPPPGPPSPGAAKPDEEGER